jgi:eukaryotic-like serine/threonine-protein kinase
LDQGHLTVKDVAQLASSLVAALDVLHTHGFIHGHIEPSNIFAVGEVVKLRSDCIHEAPEGTEGRAAKQRDVRDLATVLLLALTQRRSLEGIPAYAVPAPFGEIIRNGLDGAWGLENVRAALEGQFGSTARTAPDSVDEAVGESDGESDGALARESVDDRVRVAAATPILPVSPDVFEQKAPSTGARPSVRPNVQFSLPMIGGEQKEEFEGASVGRDIWDEEPSLSLRFRGIGAASMFAVLLLLAIWVLPHAWNAHWHKVTQTPAAASQPVARSVKQISTSRAPKPAAANGSRSAWRVIAFTYNRKTDAEKKVSSLKSSHPDLQPVVFTAHGHAPYLVSIGGVMDRDAAYTLARRSRSLGLPRDTYAQNYSH